MEEQIKRIESIVTQFKAHHQRSYDNIVQAVRQIVTNRTYDINVRWDIFLRCKIGYDFHSLDELTSLSYVVDEYYTLADYILSEIYELTNCDEVSINFVYKLFLKELESQVPHYIQDKIHNDFKEEVMDKMVLTINYNN